MGFGKHFAILEEVATRQVKKDGGSLCLPPCRQYPLYRIKVKISIPIRLFAFSFISLRLTGGGGIRVFPYPSVYVCESV